MILAHLSSGLFVGLAVSHIIAYALGHTAGRDTSGGDR